MPQACGPRQAQAAVRGAWRQPVCEAPARRGFISEVERGATASARHAAAHRRRQAGVRRGGLQCRGCAAQRQQRGRAVCQPGARDLQHLHDRRAPAQRGGIAPPEARGHARGQRLAAVHDGQELLQRGPGRARRWWCQRADGGGGGSNAGAGGREARAGGQGRALLAEAHLQQSVRPAAAHGGGAAGRAAVKGRLQQHVVIVVLEVAAFGGAEVAAGGKGAGAGAAAQRARTAHPCPARSQQARKRRQPRDQPTGASRGVQRRQRGVQRPISAPTSAWRGCHDLSVLRVEIQGGPVEKGPKRRRHWIQQHIVIQVELQRVLRRLAACCHHVRPLIWQSAHQQVVVQSEGIQRCEAAPRGRERAVELVVAKVKGGYGAQIAPLRRERPPEDVAA
mmetsp:Transcript_39065/g.98199  ORF Transcript_39065/g.98199 Transcript_39065/m.98199 type:complete len:393 (+) Transcript_39065:1038-2216(+)